MRVNFGWQPDATLTYRWWSDQVEQTITPVSLPEVGTSTGFYSVDIVDLQRGDVVLVYEDGSVVGAAEFDPAGLHRLISP